MGTFRILSIDGGGIRGLIPALVLAEVESRTGRPVTDLFDLVAGTSTGGIIALALTRPDPESNDGAPAFSAQTVSELYRDHGPTIFAKNLWRRLPAAEVFEEKYPHEGLETVLEQYFAQTRLSEALTPVLVPSYALERRFPFFFKSERARRDPETHDFPMTTVARATSAAPTYFEPVKVEVDSGDDYYALADGGVFANNPAMCAVAEALSAGVELEDLFVVSLGTGEHTRPILYDDAKDWGLAKWAAPIISVMMDGVADTVSYQMEQILRRDAYHRIQVRLTDAMDDMDDASRTNLRALALVAHDLIRRSDADLDRIAEGLTR